MIIIYLIWYGSFAMEVFDHCIWSELFALHFIRLKPQGIKTTNNVNIEFMNMMRSIIQSPCLIESWYFATTARNFQRCSFYIQFNMCVIDIALSIWITNSVIIFQKAIKLQQSNIKSSDKWAPAAAAGLVRSTRSLATTPISKQRYICLIVVDTFISSWSMSSRKSHVIPWIIFNSSLFINQELQFWINTTYSIMFD